MVCPSSISTGIDGNGKRPIIRTNSSAGHTGRYAGCVLDDGGGGGGRVASLFDSVLTVRALYYGWQPNGQHVFLSAGCGIAPLVRFLSQ